MPLLGVAICDNDIKMVWEWMENGSITDFIASHEDANRFKLVGFHSCCQPQLLLMISSDSSGTPLGDWFTCTTWTFYTRI